MKDNLKQLPSGDPKPHEKFSPIHLAARLAGLGYWIWDEKNKCLVDVSDEYAGILGVSVEEVLNTFANEQADLLLVHEEDRDRYQRKTAKPRYNIEYRIVRPDGEIRHVREISDTYTDEKGEVTFTCGSLQDISESKNTEIAFLESEEKFQVLANNIPAVIYQCKNDARYSTLYVNDTIESLCGYSKQDFQSGKVCTTELVHPDYLDVYNVDESLAERKPFLLTFPLRHKNGSYRWVEEHGVGVFHGDDLMYIEGVIFDITERRRVDEALSESEARFRDFAKAASDWFWEMDADLRFTYFSERAYEINGLKPEDIVGKSRAELVDTRFNDPHSQQWEEHLVILEKRQAFRDFEYSLNVFRDNPIRIRISGIPIFDSEGHFKGYRGTGSDITESFKLSQQLSYQARHDALTGLVNRHEFDAQLQCLIQSDQDEDAYHALCYLDLDRFKVINDTYGHLAGDELLRQLSESMKLTVRKNDTLARIGGDEFAVLMEHCTLEQAQRLANELRSCVEDFRFKWDQKTLRVAVSIGLMPINAAMRDSSSILNCADAACYTAKKQGRNRIHVYREDDLDIAQHHSELRWVDRINQALEEDNFVLYAQAVTSVGHSTDKLLHFEILLRMLEADGKLISAGAFLPAAERYDLSIKIDQWVTRSVFEYLVDNPELAEMTGTCAINLSGASIADKVFFDFIVDELEKVAHISDKLCFEITETAAITNLSTAMTFIRILKGLGCRFSLDDFGSGLSSFAYLKNLPVDYLKIDGAFVRDIAVDPIDRAMVKSINEIGQVMGKQTIAEFVEDEDILDVLKAIKVDYAQGYFIGQPLALEEFFRLSQ